MEKVEKFIDDLVVDFTYDSIVLGLSKFNDFLVNNNYNISDEFLLDLLNNNSKFNKIVKTLYKDSAKRVLFDDVKVEKNFFLIRLIDLYCTSFIDYDFSYSSYSDSITVYLSEMPKELLSDDEVLDLAYKVRSGDKEAEKKLVKYNTRLVVSIAKRYVGRGVDFADLIQEGNLGLIKGVERYDPSLGFKISTYLHFWIRQSIGKAIRKGRTVSISSGKNDQVNKMYNVMSKLSRDFGRQPTDQEIADEMEISISELHSLYGYSKPILSLNECVGDGDETELGDFIPDNSVCLEDTACESTIKNDLLKFMSIAGLSDREIDVLICRYGLNGNVYTLDYIGRKYHLTRERIRQIERSALRKLRLSFKAEDFVNYMDNPDKILEDLPSYKRRNNRDFSSFDSFTKFKKY